MPFSNNDYLPSHEELKVQEINLSAAPLKAGAVHFGRYCDEQCKEYMLCSKEEKDPRRCLNEGKEVTRCGMRFYQDVKQNCADEFTKYWKCVDHARHDMDTSRCKKTQGIFDKCMSEKLGIERPDLGFFSRVRVHKTNRPKPKRTVPLPEPIPGPPEITPEEFKKRQINPGLHIFT